jgi:putative transposase
MLPFYDVLESYEDGRRCRFESNLAVHWFVGFYGTRIEEGHLMSDHVHILISIPPKYSVSQVIGFIKGKSAISIARTYTGRRKNFTGQSFWARGYYVSTVGRDEETVRNYIKHQEEEDKRIEQLDLF